jgi:transposase-like protein
MYKAVNQETKQTVVKEMLQRKSTVGELSKKYSISKSAIYTWFRKHNNKNQLIDVTNIINKKDPEEILIRINGNTIWCTTKVFEKILKGLLK